MTSRPAISSGTRAALVLVGILLFGANLRASITPVGPVLGTIQHDLGIGDTASSLLIVLPLLTWAIFSPTAPPIAARLGIDRTLAWSLALLAVGIVLRSIPVAGLIWVGTVILGFALALINVIVPALVKREHPNRIGTLTGAYSAMNSIFAAIAAGLAVPIAGLAPQGWRLSLGIWAGLAIIAFALYLPLLRSAEAPLATSPVPTARRSPWTTALGWQVTLYMGLQSAAYYSIILWWPSIEHDAGVPLAVAGLHQVAFQITGLLGNICCTWALRRLTDQRPIAVFVGVMLFAAMLGQLLVPTAALLWVIIAGLGCGAAIVLALSLFGLRTRHHSEAAALSGMAQSAGYTLAAAGAMAVGVLHDLTGSWSLSLGLLAALMVVVFVCGLLAARDGVMPSSRR